MLGYIAKAITALVVSGLIYWLGDVDLVNGMSDDIEAIVLAILTSLGVFAVPNTGVRRARPFGENR